MANYPVLVSIQLKDYLGVVTTHDVFLQVAEATTLTQLVTAVTDYQELVDPLVGGQIEAVHARIICPVSGEVKASPVAGDENEKTGLFNFSQSATAYKYGVDLPGIAETLIVDGKIDLTNAGLQAWILWLTTAHGTIQAISKFLYLLVDLVDALLSFRKHRKAENRRSVESP